MSSWFEDTCQDYFLFHLLLVSCDDRLPLLVDNRSSTDRSLFLIFPIFDIKPSVGAGSFRRLLRFTAGLEDFARADAHHPRRHAFPKPADDSQAHVFALLLLTRTCSLRTLNVIVFRMPLQH